MASFVYNAGADGLTENGIAWESDTIKVRLITGGTPGKDDTSMTGMTAATGSTDPTLATMTKVKNTTDDRIEFGSANVSFTGLSSTGTATHLIVYKFVTDDAGSTPIAAIDITDQALTGATQADYTVPGGIWFYLQQ